MTNIHYSSKLAKLICAFIGHTVDKTKVIGCGSGQGKWETERGYIAYHFWQCTCCYKHIPIDEENRIEKEKLEKYIGDGMNASRAQYGLKPISWEL